MRGAQTNSDSRAARKFILDHFFERATPPVIEEMMRRFRLGRAEAVALLKELEADHQILLLPGTQRILMANPFSAVTTPFRVRIGSMDYFANCAWDTVSMHVMTGIDAKVESYCHHCGEPIELLLSDGKVKTSQPPEPLIFLSMPVARWYENLVNTCSNNMVYFASRRHMEEWLAANPSLKGEVLTVEKMAQVCTPLSRGRMGLGYERPTKEALMAYWDSIGMKGRFWKF